MPAGGLTRRLACQNIQAELSCQCFFGGKPCEVDKSGINKFCFSKLWSAQICGQATAINENQFVVPGLLTGQIFSSAEGRRNYTDLQETAQWLGGQDVPTKILEELLKGLGLKNHVVLDSTLGLVQS